MITLSHTVAEAFQRGARIAKESDADERYLTVQRSIWQLTGSEWTQLRWGVWALSRFLASAGGRMPRQPIPSPEVLRDFKWWDFGVEFFFTAEGYAAEPMSSGVLEHCVRNMPEYGFADGDTIAEAGSHSHAELWTDVILPAIERGEIEVTVGGEPLR